MAPAIVALEAECRALGTILFTITAHDLTAGVFRRIHTSHPVEYPLGGTKPLERDAWYDLCVVQAQPFVANAPEGFRSQFLDHALIESMGLGSAANLPIIDAAGVVPGTINLLAGPGHFTQTRLHAYQMALAARIGPLLDAVQRRGAPPFITQ